MTVCPPEHRHGETTTCYILHKCRCAECRRGISQRESRRKKLKAYGRWVDPYVPAQPVREHVQHLRAFGFGWKRIAELSGVGNTAIASLVYGRKGASGDPRRGEVVKRIAREKAERILAVKPDIDALAAGAVIPARGTHRRVQALVAIGWSQSKLAARLGMKVANFGSMLHRQMVTVATHRAVAALFDELWDKTPPRETRPERAAYTRALRYAKARGWLPPLAWDDIDNDPVPPTPDEPVLVDEQAVELAVGGERVRLRPEERREAIRRLHALGLSDGEIATRLHANVRVVFRIRKELGLRANFDARRRVA